MFKKVTMIALVVVVTITLLAIPANAMAMSESDRPIGFIGIDIYTKMKQEFMLSGKDELETEYMAEMANFNGYWIVQLSGATKANEDYAAAGIYDHFPTEEEMATLWANRIESDKLDEIMDELN